MPKLKALAILTLLLTAFWLALRQRPQVPEAPAPSSSHATPQSRPQAAPQAPRPTPQASQRRMKALHPISQALRPAQKPDDNTVEFQIVNGLAITYGDLILGKPDPDFQGERGLYEAPTPQPWERGVVPYHIQPNLPEPERIEKAISYLNKNTSVKFVPYDGQKDAIVFEVGLEHCFSALGRVGGLQPITLAPGCGTQEILHEILHALGFVHEQSRPDRDRYVQVFWENIEEKYRQQFAIIPDALFEIEKDSPFDYRSIMMYDARQFSLKDDLTTLGSKSSQPISPVGAGLSEGDLKRINRVYGVYY